MSPVLPIGTTGRRGSAGTICETHPIIWGDLISMLRGAENVSSLTRIMQIGSTHRHPDAVDLQVEPVSDLE